MIQHQQPSFINRHKKHILIGTIAGFLGYGLGFVSCEQSTQKQYANRIMGVVEQGFAGKNPIPSTHASPEPTELQWHTTLLLKELRSLKQDLEILKARQPVVALPSASPAPSLEDRFKERRESFDKDWHEGRRRIQEQFNKR